MGWHPSVTRATTLYDLLCAFRGWQKSQGHDPDDKPFGRSDLEALERKVGGSNV